ncbi:MAG: hypothetical protein AAGI23_10950 [Bacteroidota bacterium]
MKHTLWIGLVVAIAFNISCESEPKVSEVQTIYNEAQVGIDSLSNDLANVYEDFGALQARYDNLMNEARSLSSVDSVALAILQQAGSTLSGQAGLLESIENRLDSFDELDPETATPETLQESISALEAEYPDMNAKLTAVRDALTVVRTKLDGVQENLTPKSTDD